MFSVGAPGRQAQASSSYLRLGAAPLSFDFQGNRLENSSSNFLELDYTAFYIAFETPGVIINLMLANQLTGLDEQSLFDLGFTLTNRFTILRGSAVQAGLPIQLYSSVTAVNSDRSNENFNQANFAVGAGGFLNFRFSNKLIFSNEFVPGYGFSNSSGGFIGGSMYYLRGKSRLNFINLLGARSLSIGYDFNFRSFDIEDEIYDFDFTSHLITLGISL